MKTTECTHCAGTGMLDVGRHGEYREVRAGETFICGWCNGSGRHVEWPDEIWEEGERQQGPITYSGNTITTNVERTALAFRAVLTKHNIPHVMFRDPNHNSPCFTIQIRTGGER